MNTLRMYTCADALMALMDDETATDEQIQEAFAMVNDKAGAVAAVCKNLGATTYALDAEIRRLQQIKKTADNRLEWLKGYTIHQMQRMEVEELRSGVHTLKLRQNPPSVVIEDEAALPAKYIRIVQEQKIDKAGIKDALKAGEHVHGAHLERGIRLEVK